MNVNDEIILYNITNEQFNYKIRNTKVIDTKTDKIGIYIGTEELVLVTCWPFDSLDAGGSERYVVYTQKL